MYMSHIGQIFILSLQADRLAKQADIRIVLVETIIDLTMISVCNSGSAGLTNMWDLLAV